METRHQRHLHISETQFLLSWKSLPHLLIKSNASLEAFTSIKVFRDTLRPVQAFLIIDDPTPDKHTEFISENGKTRMDVYFCRLFWCTTFLRRYRNGGHDLFHLVHGRRTGKQWLSRNHFSQDTTQTPHVYTFSISKSPLERLKTIVKFNAIL